jgi:hypothetical protein
VHVVASQKHKQPSGANRVEAQPPLMFAVTALSSYAHMRLYEASVGTLGALTLRGAAMSCQEQLHGTVTEAFRLWKHFEQGTQQRLGQSVHNRAPTHLLHR